MRLESFVGLVGLLILTWLCFQVLLPFLAPLVWAVAIVTALHRPYRRHLLPRTKGRQSLAAGLAVIVVSVAIVLPISLLALVLFGEIGSWYDAVRDRIAAGEFDPVGDVQRHPLYVAVSSRISALLERAGVEIDLRRTLLGLADSARGVTGNLLRGVAAGTGGLLVDFGLMLIALFFLFRDGEHLAVWLQRLSPLGVDTDRMIFERFVDVTAATLIGTLATGASQGVVGGLLLAVLGVPNALLWGATMALTSFVPVLGAGLVWVPAALWLLVQGEVVRGLVLVGGGVFLIGMVDNVVKPVVMGPRAGLHPGLVLFAVFGGLSIYGLTGLVLGPMLFALLLTFAQIYRERYADQLRRVPEPPPGASP